MKIRTKLQETLNGVLNICNLEIAFKCQTKFFHSFRFKDTLITKYVISGVVFKFKCGLYKESYYIYYGESIKHLDIRSEERIGVSPLTGKKFKQVNNIAVCDH